MQISRVLPTLARCQLSVRSTHKMYILLLTRCIVSLTGRDNHKQGDDDSVVCQIGELEDGPERGGGKM